LIGLANLLLSHAFSCICDLNVELFLPNALALLKRGSDVDFTTLQLIKLDGVGDQVEQDFLEAVRVAVEILRDWVLSVIRQANADVHRLQLNIKELDYFLDGVLHVHFDYSR